MLTAISAPKRQAAAKFRFVDMFCGIGGFHLALAALGGRCVFACDTNAPARHAYEKNFGVAPAADISCIAAKDIPPHDIFCAGFPCQPFSIIGSRAGFDDSRGALFFEIARILRAKKPAAFILENVRQLKTHNGGKTLASILAALRKIGYAVDFRVLDARDFGLPQKRERLIVVGMLAGMEFFAFPQKKVAMQPLAAVLETNPQTLAPFAVSEQIRRRRQQQHKAKIRPAIWHENKGGNVASHPFSCALRAGASYNYLLVNGERRLTPREMLRLQGFPDSFCIVCNNAQTRKQAGNAVPVPLVAAVARRVLAARARALPPPARLAS